MTECVRCKREFEGNLFRWAVSHSYPSEVLKPLCSECYIELHEEKGRGISILSQNISIYVERSNDEAKDN